MDKLCETCGASSPRSCEWHDMTGLPQETAPCEHDGTWEQDQDEEHENRDDRAALKEAVG